MITDLTNKTSEETAEQIALIYEDRKWTYRELHADVSRIAAHLFADGYHAGDRILIHLENGYEIVVCVLACIKIGLIIVQSYPDFSPADFRYMAENSGFRGMITSTPLYSKVATLPVHTLYLIENLFSSRLEKATCPSFTPDPQQPLLISYTSGTTAKRKGVIQTYHSVASSMESIVHSLGKSAFERPMMYSSLGNNGAWMFLILPTFWLNGTLIITSNAKPETVLAAIAKERPTFCFTFSFYLNQLIHHPDAKKTDFSSFKVILVGGDIVTRKLCEDFYATTHLFVSQGFGMTESQCALMELIHDPAKMGSLGLPAHGVEAKIIDAQGNELPSGATGQLLIKREATTPGYWNFPEETALTLRNGWLYTGDLAMKDTDGYYWFKGRIKTLIIHDAQNISPIEVEEAICKHPSVQAAGVLGIPDEKWGQSVKAFIELKSHAHLTILQLQLFLEAHLAPYKIPTEIVFVEKLPRTITGKIERKALPSL